jgi:hypothetical protein
MTELKKKEVEIINADRNLIGLKQIEATHGLKITELEAQSKLDH